MGEETGKPQRGSQNNNLQFIRNKALYTGFIGGIVAGLFGIFLYYFNFIEIHPKSFVLTSWNDASWTDGKLGTFISDILIGLISIGVAFVYYLIFKSVKNMWMSIVYGIMLWGVVFYLLQPIFTNVPSLNELETSTIVSTICLYILYSVFIGYTISYDYMIYRHKQKA